MTQKFFTGDVVEYIGGGNRGKSHIIHECAYIGEGTFEYSTNQGAWFEDTDFKLIRKADTKSFAKLDKDIEDELEGI